MVTRPLQILTMNIPLNDTDLKLLKALKSDIHSYFFVPSMDNHLFFHGLIKIVSGFNRKDIIEITFKGLWILQMSKYE